MLDYAIVKNLCTELEITITELLDGEDVEKKNNYAYDEE